MGWSRLLWGAKFTGSDKITFLAGEGWDPDHKDNGRPTRCLLFKTRREARAFCRSRMARWAEYPDGGCVRRWRISPVRVRETVEEVE